MTWHDFQLHALGLLHEEFWKKAPGPWLSLPAQQLPDLEPSQQITIHHYFEICQFSQRYPFNSNFY